MLTFEARLNQARNGRGVIFCGAGFSADCLNFNPDVTIGTGAHLLGVLNSELARRGNPHNFKDLRNAADAFMASAGETALMDLLVERFTIQNVSADMVSILRFPWERVYTTNYDNGIEQALRSATRKHKSFNNLDKPSDITDVLPVIHLHGFVEKWTRDNFLNSCILGAESYHRLDKISQWLNTFRYDVERAELVAFVGFNAADFHLNEVLFNVSTIREKMVFINRSAAEPDPDIRMTQERYGHPHYIDRSGFARIVSKIMKSVPPTDPTLANFRSYRRPKPEDRLPSVTDIEALFLFGKINVNQLARDTALGLPDYHVPRAIVDEIFEDIEHGVRIVLLVGEICDGKSLALEDLMNRLSINRSVFCLRHPYEDLLDEVSRILHAHPRAALVVENCFELREDRLASLGRTFDGSEGLLLLSSRNISAEAESRRVHRLRELDDFRQYYMGSLTEREISALIPLVDQLAAWRHLQERAPVNKKQFIIRTCNSSLPAFLLRLLKSQYVRQRYREEYNKTADFSTLERTAIISALYMSHMGHNAPLEFLSNALEVDVGRIVDRLSRMDDGLRLVARRGEYLDTVPSIGARNILEHIVADADIVDSIVTVLQYLARNRSHNDFERYMFGQMMRYSILQSVVTDREQINRFFDNISKNRYLRTRVLFWLQWHMAKTDMREFDEAEKFLQQGYTEAKNYERETGRRYNRNQLDDRKAKFLMIRDYKVDCAPIAVYHDIREACRIVERLLRQENLTHHPFETLKEILGTFMHRQESLLDEQRSSIARTVGNASDRAESALRRVPHGYQQNRATSAMNEIFALVEELAGRV